MENEIVRMIGYFWKEREDLERWSSWEKNLPIIKEKYPEIIVAWENYKIAIKTLDRLVETLEHE